MPSVSHVLGWSAVRLACALAVVAALFGGLPVERSRSAAFGDGSITITVWECPSTAGNNGSEATDPDALAAACTTPTVGLTFFLTLTNTDVPLIRKTGYPDPGSSTISWNPPFSGGATVQLSEPPANAISQVFCDQGQGRQPVAVPDGVTLFRNVTVPAGGIACTWYLVPTQETPPTPAANSASSPTVATPPTAVPTVKPTQEPAPTSTVSSVTAPLRIRELAPLPGDSQSEAFAIGDGGIIVGDSYRIVQSSGPLPFSAVRWTDEGRQVEALPTLPNTVASWAYAVNGNGDIVGWDWTSDGVFGVLWVNGEMQMIGQGYAPAAINDRAQIVGVFASSNASQAFLWQDGAATLLGDPGYSGAADINGNGLIAGQSNGQAVVWDSSGEMTMLGIAGEAVAINDEGVVLVDDQNGNVFLYDIETRNTEPQQLAKLHRLAGYGEGLNDANVAVGSSCSKKASCQYPHTGVKTTPTLWWDGEAVDLGALLSRAQSARWSAMSALDIDEVGDVVGTGSFAPDGGSSEAQRGFLLLAAGPVGSPTPIDASTVTAAGPATYRYDFVTVDENGNPLPGACYSVDGGDQQCDDDGDGSVTVTLEPGDHTISETQAPDGYQGIQDQTFTAPEGGETFQIPQTASTSPTPKPAKTPEPTAAPTSTPKPVDEPPGEFAFRGEFYLRDRVVPVSPSDLTEVTAYKGLIVYGKSADGPFSALYMPLSKRPGDGMVRYLPEQLATPDQPCPAEAAPQFAAGGIDLPLDDGTTLHYAFAGVEPDLTARFLTFTVSAPPDSPFPIIAASPASPWPEIFVPSDAGLERFVLLDATGLPGQLAPQPTFAGQPLTFRKIVKDPSKLGQLARVGCAGPFEMLAPAGQLGAPFKTVYALVGGSLVAFDAG